MVFIVQRFHKGCRASTGHALLQQPQLSPQRSGPASRAVPLPGGNTPLAGSPNGRPDPRPAPSPASQGSWGTVLLSGHRLTPGCPFYSSCFLSTAGMEAGGGTPPLHQCQISNKNTEPRQPSAGKEPICHQALLTVGFPGGASGEEPACRCRRQKDL